MRVYSCSTHLTQLALLSLLVLEGVFRWDAGFVSLRAQTLRFRPSEPCESSPGWEAEPGERSALSYFKCPEDDRGLSKPLARLISRTGTHHPRGLRS